ncbi:SDR family oxidoreductase [Afipia broomeae]|uniref:dTDP-4-dehydrorhamnose reductase n=1 Tax=Afipia broomeae ATCC 49717 TaxID=883078 RepID=K8P4H3_9BRAD|nr:SDR family oxidoreductase [Afipia broomeae]EKS36386.1 dTDP-4-dehydrorhamnose reductase [Afipia broomeae ATCC 49717]
MEKKVLVLGSTGLLGQAVTTEVRSRGYTLLAAARRGAPIGVDISDAAALAATLAAYSPDIVVNCAALADVDACEKDPGGAWLINARPLAFLAAWSRATGRKLIHVSTDHYFISGGPKSHSEVDPVDLVNEYARTKFAGEALALTAQNALVLRTNIVGIRGWTQPTFAEWAIDVVMNNRPATLFTDVYGSSIDVPAFSRALFDLEARQATGLMNLAAGEISSKDTFVRELARQLGCQLSAVRSEASVMRPVPRANCLGLDVSRAESMLGYSLPSLQQVISSLISQFRESTEK